MQNLLRMIRKKTPSMVLTALLAIFIVFNIQLPFSSYINTLFGRLVVIGLVLVLLFANPILGALGIVAAYELFRRVEKRVVAHFVPSEKKKMGHLNAMNQYSKTLEEEIVQKMIPTANPGSFPPASFKPYPNKLHNASGI